MQYKDPSEYIKHIGTPQDDKFRRAVLSRYRPISGAIASEYSRIYKKEGLRAVRSWLVRLDSELFIGDKNNRLYACSVDEEIKNWCEVRAHDCQKRFNFDLDEVPNEPEFAMMNTKAFVESHGLTFPLKLAKNLTRKQSQLAWIHAAARVQDAKWRRQAREPLKNAH